MKIRVVSPTKAYVDGDADDIAVLTKTLSYTNTANQQQLKRHYNNHWFRSKNKVAWEQELEVLKKSVHMTLVYSENGKHYIRPGSIPYLGVPESDVTSEIVYP